MLKVFNLPPSTINIMKYNISMTGHLDYGESNKLVLKPRAHKIFSENNTGAFDKTLEQRKI